MKGILDQAKFAQIGYVVNDIEETKRKFALLFGCKEAETVTGGDYEITRTTIFGKPAPKAGCKLAFMDLTSGVQLELIEPNHEPSVWRDHLDEYGEGIHHIAFQVEDADTVIAELKEKFDAVVEQMGNYGDGSGRYIYLCCHKDLKCRIELLESFKK